MRAAPRVLIAAGAAGRHRGRQPETAPSRPCRLPGAGGVCPHTPDATPGPFRGKFGQPGRALATRAVTICKPSLPCRSIGLTRTLTRPTPPRRLTSSTGREASSRSPPSWWCRPPRRSIGRPVRRLRPSRCAVASRALTRRPRPEGWQRSRRTGRSRRRVIDAGQAKIAVPLACINPGEDRYLTVTHGQASLQLRPYRSPNGTTSQADSAGSIPVTRSRRKSPAQELPWRPSLVPCNAVTGPAGH